MDIAVTENEKMYEEYRIGAITMSDRTEYISRQAAYEALTDYYHHRTEIQHAALHEALSKVPPANIDLSGFSDKLWKTAYERGKAEAVRHGRWLEHKDYPGLAYLCSECNLFTTDRSFYCPNCGARMGEAE